MLIIHYLRPMARAIKNKREAILIADINFEQMNTITNIKVSKISTVRGSIQEKPPLLKLHNYFLTSSGRAEDHLCQKTRQDHRTFRMEWWARGEAHLTPTAKIWGTSSSRYIFFPPINSRGFGRGICWKKASKQSEDSFESSLQTFFLFNKLSRD